MFPQCFEYCELIQFYSLCHPCQCSQSTILLNIKCLCSWLARVTYASQGGMTIAQLAHLFSSHISFSSLMNATLSLSLLFFVCSLSHVNPHFSIYALFCTAFLHNDQTLSCEKKKHFKNSCENTCQFSHLPSHTSLFIPFTYFSSFSKKKCLLYLLQKCVKAFALIKHRFLHHLPQKGCQKKNGCG